MKVLELISVFRQKTNDYKSSHIQVMSLLRQGERHLFNELGGASNPDISGSLQEVVTDVVAEGRTVIVFPNDAATEPKALFDGKVCHVIDQATALSIDSHPALKPSVVFETRKATFYFNKPYSVPSEASSRRSTWPVKVTYYRNPKTMLYLGGFQAKVEDSGFGMKGKANLSLVKVIWPDGRPYFNTNELVGAYISLQVNENERLDYRIEEHAGGVLGSLYVNQSYDTVPYVDMNWGSESASKGSRATIHRSSELPEAYHQAIVDRTVEMVLGRVEEKK